MSANENSNEVIVESEEVKRFIIDCLMKIGTSESHATQLAEVLVAGDYRGHYSHGLNRLEMYVREIEFDICLDQEAPTILKDNPATAWVDGKNLLGPVVGNFCMDLAIKKAKEAGIASNHFGIAGWYALRAQNHGLVGMAFTNTSPLMFPTRSKQIALGTNPLAFSAPGLNEDNFTLDMATTTVALGKVEMAERKGIAIPKGWAADGNGQETNNPSAVLQNGGLLPLAGSEITGGYKGYGLAAMVEILCGILASADWGPHIRSWKNSDRIANLGQCFIAIDPGSFAPAFEQRNQELLDTLRQLEPTDSGNPVLVAGDPERIHMALCDRLGGIPYHSNQIKHSTWLIQMLKSTHPHLSNKHTDIPIRNAFCISFRPYDKILLFPYIQEIASLLRRAVEEHWTIDSETNSNDCYSLKLSGTPFLKHTGREHAILLKCLCSVVLERLKHYNWELVLCTDLSCKTDLTAWYFRKSASCASSKDNDTFKKNASLAGVVSKTWSFVCLSLSKNRQIQLINAPAMLHHALKNAVQTHYRFGIDKEIDHGGDYEIKLNGSPWDTKNRDQIVGALKMLLAVFRKFAANGFHLYGLVNLKETADSLFFEYDRSQTTTNDQYMIITMEADNLLRLIGAPIEIVEIVESILQEHWRPGFSAPKESIDIEPSVQANLRQARTSSNPNESDPPVCYEYKMKGTPWRAGAFEIGESRRLITVILDHLLAHGWTVVTGIDVSRTLNSKSALLFQSCAPVKYGLRHVCLSPLSKRSLQVTNGPPALRQLIKEEFKDIISEEKLSEDEIQFVITLEGFNWDPEVDGQCDSYTYVRRRMGCLLEKLLDAKWMVIASADVAHQLEAAGVGEGIHSWFLLYCGQDDGHMVKDILRVGARIGSGKCGN